MAAVTDACIDEAEAVWLDMKARLADPPVASVEALAALLRDVVLFQVSTYRAGEAAVEPCFIASSAMRLAAHEVLDALDSPLCLDEAACLLEFSGLEAALLLLELADHRDFEPHGGPEMAAALAEAEYAWRVDGAPLNLCSAAHAVLVQSADAALVAPVAHARTGRCFLDHGGLQRVGGDPDTPSGGCALVAWALASTAGAVDELEAVRRAWIARDFATPEAWRRGERACLPADAMARLRAWDAERAGAAHAACAARFPEALAGKHAAPVLIGVLNYYMQQIHGLDFADLFYADDLIPEKLERKMQAHRRSAVRDAPPLIVRHRATWYLVGRAGSTPFSSGTDCIAAWLDGIKDGRVLGVDISQTLASIR